MPVLPPVTMVTLPVRSGISLSGTNLDFGGKDWSNKVLIVDPMMSGQFE